MRRLLLTALVAVFAAPVSAQTFFDGHLATAPCFTRTYDGEHLRANPRQSVKHFQIATAADDPLAGSHPTRFTVRFQFQVKKSDEVFSGMAECRSRSGGAFCQVEGDGGVFAMTPEGQGVRVMLGDRLEVEGGAGVSPDLARADNQVMLLRRGNVNACGG